MLEGMNQLAKMVQVTLTSSMKLAFAGWLSLQLGGFMFVYLIYVLQLAVQLLAGPSPVGFCTEFFVLSLWSFG